MENRKADLNRSAPERRLNRSFVVTYKGIFHGTLYNALYAFSSVLVTVGLYRRAMPLLIVLSLCYRNFSVISYGTRTFPRAPQISIKDIIIIVTLVLLSSLVRKINIIINNCTLPFLAVQFHLHSQLRRSNRLASIQTRNDPINLILYIVGERSRA